MMSLTDVVIRHHHVASHHSILSKMLACVLRLEAHNHSTLESWLIRTQLLHHQTSLTKYQVACVSSDYDSDAILVVSHVDTSASLCTGDRDDAVVLHTWYTVHADLESMCNI